MIDFDIIEVKDNALQVLHYLKLMHMFKDNQKYSKKICRHEKNYYNLNSDSCAQSLMENFD